MGNKFGSHVQIHGYIFDIDHTLLNSDKAQIDAALWALDQVGIKRTYAQILKEFDRATDDMLAVVMGQEGIDRHVSVAHIATLATEKLLDLIPTIPTYPRVQEIFDSLHAQGFRIGLASNNYNTVIDAMITHFRWQPYIAAYAGIDDFPPDQRKPHPAMVKKVVHAFGLDPRQCVMVGDSFYDIQAGQHAGCHTIAVCTGNAQKDAFLSLHPDLILDSISDLLAYLPVSF